MRAVMGCLVVWVFASAAWANAADGGVASDPAIENAGENRVEEILVVGQRENRESRGALVLPMSLFETPQAVSVVDAGFIEDFGLDDVNQLLNLVTGVNVEQVETDRTYYNARGFDIKSMQVDGIGLPFNWNVVGALDTYVYEKVEVIRGANGMLTGVGNPSGTINYIRKRPTNDTFFKTEVTAGSWDKQRVEADLSGPLTASGSWAGRLLGAAQSGDSYLDNYENERAIVSGILEGQVGDRATVTFGYTQQNNNSKGVLWGALPMLYDDGTQTEFPRSQQHHAELDEVGYTDPHRLCRRNVCVLVAMELADDAYIQRLRRTVEAVLHVWRTEPANRRGFVRLSGQLPRGVRSRAVRQHIERRVRRVRAHPRSTVGNEYFPRERKGEAARGTGRRSGVGCDARVPALEW